ncbi:MAG: hypothetical protein GEV08_22195 [Acidimicrobiia bacterium]|nr:hypothetical protein [Acidimicrobiia bacterium]
MVGVKHGGGAGEGGLLPAAVGVAVEDDVESSAGQVAGLGLLPVATRFAPDKVTRLRSGEALGHAVHGYQVHHGRVAPEGGRRPEAFLTLEDGAVDGVQRGSVFGTTLHGLFEADGFRAGFLEAVAARAGKRFVPAPLRTADPGPSGVDHGDYPGDETPGVSSPGKRPWRWANHPRTRRRPRRPARQPRVAAFGRLPVPNNRRYLFEGHRTERVRSGLWTLRDHQ